MNNIRFISSFTTGTIYEKIIHDLLVPSLEHWNLPYYIFAKPDLGNWAANSRQRPLYIKAAMEAFPGENIVWVDADARILKYPDLLFHIPESIHIGVNYLKWCYSEDTEVFTYTGWKFFKDLTRKDMILTREFNGDVHWNSIKHMTSEIYNDKLISLKTKFIDLLVTPNHKFYLLNKRPYLFGSNQTIKIPVTDYKIVEATYFKKYRTSYKIPQNFKWEGVEQKFFILPKIDIKLKGKTIKTYPDLKIPMDVWCKFLGLYLSEGSATIRYDKKYGHNFSEVSIAQNHTSKKDKFISNILKDFPLSFMKTSRGWKCTSKQLAIYLQKFGYCDKKYIPLEIKNLIPQYLQMILDSLIFGDGTRNDENYFIYYTSSKQLADDVQEIIFKLGQAANISILNRIGRESTINKHQLKTKKLEYRITNKIGKHIGCQNLNGEEIQYNGKIYGIDVGNPHTLFVRRNGKCCWSGNSDQYGRPQDKDIVELLDGTSYYQNSPAMIPFMEEWIRRSVECEVNHRHILKKMIEEQIEENLQLFVLPREYCYIMTKPDGSQPAVPLQYPTIAHYQASRLARHNLYGDKNV